ncbi:MAG: tetratricopeptide repeat protein [Acidimicrobiales bacterium]
MAEDRSTVIAGLERQLESTPRATRPHEHAIVAYRLGMAYSEAPGANPADGLRKALACYDSAASIFDPILEPVQHGRVLNAAGAAHRGLGDRAKAAALFEKAATLLAEAGDNERAAVFNNLGLVRAEMGQVPGAIEALGQAVDLFDADTPEGRRGRVATLVNRGQANTALGTDESLDEALSDFEQARADLDPDEAPYHQGLVEHSVGVTCSALATRRPEEAKPFLKEAVRAFTASLEVFTRAGFPFQFALAKHNLGLAYAGLGGTQNRRRALACFEDAVGTLDTRLHGDAWRQAYGSLERVEKALAEAAPGLTRTGHFVSLAATVGDEERMAMVKERLAHLLGSPEPRRTNGLVEFVVATGHLDEAGARTIFDISLQYVMELPQENHEVTLDAIYKAVNLLDPDARGTADRALDQAIGDALGGVQRIHVRDYLYTLGWERP